MHTPIVIKITDIKNCITNKNDDIPTFSRLDNNKPDSLNAMNQANA